MSGAGQDQAGVSAVGGGRAGARAWRVLRGGHVYGIADTGLSSLGNLAVNIVVARSATTDDYGVFAVTMLTGIIAVGVARALFAEPLVLRYSAAPTPERRAAAEQGLGSAVQATILASPVLAVLLAGVLLASGAGARQAVGIALALAVILVALVAQDYLRFVSYSHERPRAAFLNSGAWTVALVGCLAVASLSSAELPGWGFILLWGSTALAGAVTGLVIHRLRVRPVGLRGWFSRHGRLARRLLMDFALLQATAEAATLLVAMTAGAGNAGLIRKAQIPLAPVVVMTNGIVVVTQPALVRTVSRGGGLTSLRRRAWLVGGVVAMSALALSLLVWALPEDLMASVVGDDWAQARRLVPILGVYFALGGLAGCLGVALRAAGRLPEQLRVRYVLAPLTLGLVFVGATTAGATGAVLALAFSLLLTAVAWAWLLQRYDVVAPAEGGGAP